jgi:hypothetical protein
VTVTASDPTLHASQTFNWFVDANPVSLTSPGDQSGSDGGTVSLHLSALTAVAEGALLAVQTHGRVALEGGVLERHASGEGLFDPAQRRAAFPGREVGPAHLGDCLERLEDLGRGGVRRGGGRAAGVFPDLQHIAELAGGGLQRIGDVCETARPIGRWFVGLARPLVGNRQLRPVLLVGAQQRFQLGQATPRLLLLGQQPAVLFPAALHFGGQLVGIGHWRPGLLFSEDGSQLDKRLAGLVGLLAHPVALLAGLACLGQGCRRGRRRFPGDAPPFDAIARQGHAGGADQVAFPVAGRSGFANMFAQLPLHPAAGHHADDFLFRVDGLVGGV